MEVACISKAAVQDFNKTFELFVSKSKELNVLRLHLCLTCVRSRKKQRKNTTDNTTHRYAKKDFLKVLAAQVSALRNSNGGFILIHICDKHQDDGSLNLSFFDEFADAKLKKLICDGSLYTDCYGRWMLCESDDEAFKKYKNIIVLKVSKTKGVSTVEYNTKIGSDHEVEEPKFYELYSLLTKESNQACSKGTARGINKLYESRCVQLKSFPHQDEKYQGVLDKEDLSGLVECIWEKLRLPEYIASISNIPNGGSYYVGVVEEKESHLVRNAGFKFNVKRKDDLIDELKKRVKSLLTLKSIDSDFKKGESIDDLISIELHPVNASHVVLEVCIGYLPGVVFYGEGPVAYKVKDEVIEHITVKEWQKLFKSFWDVSVFYSRS